MSDEGQTPQVEAPLDRKDVLREQFSELEQAQPNQPAAPAAPKADLVTEDETKDRFSPYFGKPAGQPRDQTGRFAAKAPAAAVPPGPTDQQPAALEPWQTAPKSWKKDLAADWQKLDPRYQQYVHEREQQMHAGVEPLLPKVELADKMMQAAQPYMQTIMGLGIDLPQAVAGLMQVDHGLRYLPYEQKLQLLVQTARSYGIDLTGQMQQAVPLTDSVMQQQQNELLQLRGQFNEYIQQQRASEQEAALEQIRTFSQKAEYFEDARPEMVRLLQSGFASGIEDAYEKAIRLNSDLFDKVQSARQAATDAASRKAADDAAKRARGAAVQVKSATPGTTAPTTARDRRSVIRDQLDALSERL